MAGDVLVIGGTGTVGGLVLKELVERGVDARVLVRDERRAAHLPAHIGRHVGDLADTAAVRRALDGVRSAFYVPPHEADEVRLGASFLKASEDAGVRVVFAGFHVADDEARAQYMEAMPAYRSKLEIAAAIAAAPSVRAVMLSLSNYNQNDETFKEDILNGVYPTPIKGANRIDLRDAAEVAATALTDPDFAAGAYDLIGPETLSGAESAEIWAAELGRPVTYLEEDEAWQAVFRKRLDGRKLNDWIASFNLLKSSLIPTDPAQVEKVTRLLGHRPRDYRGYVREHARLWLNSAPAK